MTNKPKKLKAIVKRLKEKNSAILFELNHEWHKNERMQQIIRQQTKMLAEKNIQIERLKALINFY